MKTAGTLLLAAFLSLVSLAVAAQDYTAAERLGPADLDPFGCPPGAFWDPRNFGECWTCDGAERTVFPVTSDSACRAALRVEQSPGVQLTYGLSSCPVGTWTDVVRQVCLRCPSRFANVAGQCIRRTGGRITTASVSSRRRLFASCPSGSFAGVDPTRCYTCPRGYNEVLGACHQPIRVLTARAVVAKELTTECAVGTYAIVNGGSCWTCPDGFREVGLAAVPGFCVRAGLPSFSAARFLKRQPITAVNFRDEAATLFCAAYGDRAFFDPAEGGSCWRCSASHPERTVFPVMYDRACARTRAILCESVVDALASAKLAAERLRDAAGDVREDLEAGIPGLEDLKPLMELAQSSMEEAQKAALSALPLDDLAEEISAALPRSDILDGVDRVGAALGGRMDDLAALLLSTDLVCYADVSLLQELIDEIMREAGLYPTSELAPFLQFSVALNLTGRLPQGGQLVPLTVSLQGALSFDPAVQFVPYLAFAVDEAEDLNSDPFEVSTTLGWIPPVPGDCDDGEGGRATLVQPLEMLLQLAENLTATAAIADDFGVGLSTCPDRRYQPRISGIGLTAVRLGRVSGIRLLTGVREALAKGELERPKAGVNTGFVLSGPANPSGPGLVQ